MLFIAAVEKWVGPSVGNRPRVGSSGSTDWILNTENLWKIQVRATTETKGYYCDNKWDRRKPASYIEMGDTLASVTAAYDRTYASNAITLPVFENDDTSSTQVDRLIPVSSITRATAYPADTDLTWLYYNEGARQTVRVLVNYTLQEIIDLADSGSTSTS